MNADYHFASFDRRENRHSLEIVDRKEIAHFQELLNAPFLNGQFSRGFLGSEQKRSGANRLPEFVPESPLQKGSLGVIFSPSNYRENAHSKSANFKGRHSGGHLLGRPLLFTSEFPRSEHGIRGNGPLRRENGPSRKGNAALTLMGSFGHPTMVENSPSRKAH